MNNATAFLGLAPTDAGCSLAVLFPKFTTASYRVRLADLRRFDGREDHRELVDFLRTGLRDLRTPLGGALAVHVAADVSGGIRGQLLLAGLERLRREPFPRPPRWAAVILTASGEVPLFPDGAGFTKLPRPLAASALVRVASGGRLDIEQKGKLAREFLAQLDRSRQKSARDEEEPYDLVDAVSLATYALARKADPVVRRLEEERRRKPW